MQTDWQLDNREGREQIFNQCVTSTFSIVITEYCFFFFKLGHRWMQAHAQKHMPLQTNTHTHKEKMDMGEFAHQYGILCWIFPFREQRSNPDLIETSCCTCPSPFDPLCFHCSQIYSMFWSYMPWNYLRWKEVWTDKEHKRFFISSLAPLTQCRHRI